MNKEELIKFIEAIDIEEVCYLEIKYYTEQYYGFNSSSRVEKYVTYEGKRWVIV